ncbi:hypothetical protein OE88DRAFT_1668404 [Heliocybe sulcata]|uniref:Uncharacterized protein n=1 Tax=Heliocybe sulcata TaxID=5364 RepID=A0A5C3MMR4_9AGAM|nr:hypothetical protein OE88DRAFT_1668404 [Heliocybe sulcata]
MHRNHFARNPKLDVSRPTPAPVARRAALGHWIPFPAGMPGNQRPDAGSDGSCESGTLGGIAPEQVREQYCYLGRWESTWCWYQSGHLQMRPKSGSGRSPV